LPPRLHVQLASEVAAEQIALMSREYIEHGLSWGWTASRVREAIRHRETNVAVVQRGKAVQAFGIMNYSERHAHLQLLAVHPAQRRKGLATAIVNWLESVALTAGSERVFVECRRSNDAARGLYLDLGYHERLIESAMYAGREDGILLEKWLRLREHPESDA